MTALQRIEVALAAKNISTALRQKFKGQGVTLDDGSYPIPNKDYLRRAIQSYGRCPPEKRAELRAHIMRRAKALGAMDMVPMEWKGGGSGG